MNTQAFKAFKDDSKKVQEQSREMLLAKIHSLQSEASSSIADVSNHYERVSSAIKATAIQATNYLTSFIDYCDSLINHIQSYPSLLPAKQFYTPIEQLLTSQSPNLDNLKGPELVIQDSCSQTFRFYLPTLPHLLFSYNWTISIEEDLITVISANSSYIYKDFKQDIDGTSRFLMVSESKVLFAGGVSWKDFSAYIDIKENKAKVFKKLNVGRYKHALSWIDGKPVVIGGVSEGECVNSVEILHGSEWNVHSNLHYPRCNLTAVNDLSYVYVIGGTTDYEGKNLHRTIEKWQGRWVVLELLFPEGICNVGAVSIGSELIILGGKGKQEGTNGVFHIGLQRSYYKKFPLLKDVYFKNNSLVLGHYFVKGKCFQRHKEDRQYTFEYSGLTDECVLIKDHE